MSAPPGPKPARPSKQLTLDSALAVVPLFSELDERARADLSRCARLSSFAAGDVVIERGDPAHALFAVVSGKLKVVAPRAEGRDATLHILGPGDVFGEVALFQERGRSARVAVLEPAQLIVIDRRDFMQLLSRSSELARRVLSLIAARLQDTIEHFDAATSLSVEQRLARKLLALARLFGAQSPAGELNVMLSLSQSDLAELIDSSRQTVNRLLRSFRDQKLLRLEEGRLVLLDLDGLRALGD